MPLGESRVAADFIATSSIAAGQQYALSVGRTDANWDIRYRSGDPCPGGNFSSTIGGPWVPVPPFGGNQIHDWVISVFVDPASEFSIARLNGRQLSVTVPGPGAIVVAGNKLIKGSSATATAAGAPVLTLNLTKRAKHRLVDAGVVKLSAAITFTPTGGTARTQTVRLKLKKKR